MGQDILLEMKDICKEFPGVKALDNVSLTVRRGTVHALMGENGAGKSTLMKCLFGIYQKDSGQILLEGKEVNFKNSKEALESGVAMVHQELNQALKRNVMDNIWLGYHGCVQGAGDRCGPEKGHEHDARIPEADGGNCKGGILPFQGYRI